MARQRMISPSFFTDYDVASLTSEAQLLFIGMWCYGDDFGFYQVNPIKVKGEIFKNNDRITIDNIPKLIQELSDSYFIITFEYKRDKFAYIRNWEKHQKLTYKSFSTACFPTDIRNEIIHNLRKNYEELHLKQDTNLISIDSFKSLKSPLKVPIKSLLRPFEGPFTQTETDTEAEIDIKTETESEKKSVSDGLQPLFISEKDNVPNLPVDSRKIVENFIDTEIPKNCDRSIQTIPDENSGILEAFGLCKTKFKLKDFEIDQLIGYFNRGMTLDHVKQTYEELCDLKNSGKTPKKIPAWCHARILALAGISKNG